MVMRGPVLIGISLALALAPRADAQSAMGRSAAPNGSGRVSDVLAITNATVLPMDAPRVLRRYTVVIRAGRIVGLAPDSLAVVPADARHIDARGQYLLPGLVDAHVHLLGAESARDLNAYLAHGVTTVRNMYGEPYHVEWRSEIAAGTRRGPALYTTSPFAEDLPSEAAARQFVAEAKARGYDAVKVHLPLPAPIFRALTEEGRARRIPVVGHPPDTSVGLVDAVRAGQHTFEHVEALMQLATDQRSPDTAAIAAVVNALRGTGACVTPTLVTFDHVIRMTEQYPRLTELLARPAMRFASPEVRDAWQPDHNEYVTRWRGQEAELPGALAKFRRQFSWMQMLTRRLAEAGIPIVTGTDASVAMVIPGASLTEEVNHLRAAGLSPWKALAAATSTAAECLGGASEFGTVAVGKRADLVLVAEDPLVVPSTLVKPVGVVARGRWLDPAALASGF
jgi:imidazolonepropionase-like amidohydrolase